MTPLRAQRMRLTHANAPDLAWLHDVLNRECERFGTRVNRTKNDSFALLWDVGRESAAATVVS
jgi:hypothetical protein